MPLECAKEFLAACTRNELRDDAFGDSEIFWKREDRQVACGYISRDSKSVGVEETKQFAATNFEGAEAITLEDLGQPGKFWKNDAGDPREWDDCE